MFRARPGRPTPLRERSIRGAIWNLVGADGHTFDEIVQSAEKEGISRATVGRHLKRFVEVGVFVKQDGYYRHNPLYVTSRLLKRRLKLDVESLRTVRSFDWWIHEMTPAGSFGLEHPQVLWKGYNATIGSAIAAYNSMLAALVKIPNIELAAEVANLLYDSEVRDPLMAFARAIWSRRNEVQLSKLDGREIRFKIRIKDGNKASAKKIENS